MIGTLFNEIFYRPLLNGLVFFTAVLPYHDLGFAVILLTIVVRFILLPFTHHSVKSQAKMRALEPHIAKIREDYKDKQDEQMKKIMELYREHGVNPFSSCIVLIIQLPILIALYHVFLSGIEAYKSNLYSFVSMPPEVHMIFLGLIDLSKPHISLAVLAAVTQFVQMKWAMPIQSQPTQSPTSKNDIAQMMTTQMTYMMPVVIFIIGLQFPAAVSLYWTTMNLFAIIHEALVRKKAQTLIATPQ
jgi:YidC/Oxa1 family membrane protein insertase